MKRFVVYFLVIACTSICHTRLFSQNSLTGDLAALADMFGGTIGVAAKNLTTNQVISVNSDLKFPSASVIKIPIMVEFFYQVAAGKIDHQASVILADSNKWGGSGVLRFFDGTTRIKLIDAVTLMIIVSDNTATNLVLDALANTHEDKLATVNQRMQTIGLKNTRLLNKLMSWETKTNSSESIRYGVGVTTPADMLLLLEKMYQGAIVSSEISNQMIDILAKQQYDSMIPRYLPVNQAEIKVAHKTGGVTETRIDAGIVYSPTCDYIVAIFCDESRDHRNSADNNATLAAAKASRMIWNYFTSSSGFEVPWRSTAINWNQYPTGKWAKLQLRQAPFPHPHRANGYQNGKGENFSYKGHYDDSSAIVIIPKGWHEPANGIDLVVHFHGHRNHVLNVMENFALPQQLTSSGKNAILILAQGPKNAPDSFGGNMEEPGGFKNFVIEILELLHKDGIIRSTFPGKIILSAHSGGYRPAAFVLTNGGLPISECYLFDAFYAQHEKFFNWIKTSGGKLISIYTPHLAEEHRNFLMQLNNAVIEYSTIEPPVNRLNFYPTDACHDCVLLDNFARYLQHSCLEDIKEVEHK